MQALDLSHISEVVSRLFRRAETMLPPEIGMKIECAFEKPAESEAGKAALFALLEHFIHCGLSGTRLCPDTEEAVVYAVCGEDCGLSLFALAEAIKAGIKNAYCDILLQPTAAIHTSKTPGSALHLTVQPRSGIVSFAWQSPVNGIDPKMFTAWLMDMLKQQRETLSFPVFLGIGISTAADSAEALADSALLHYMDQPSPYPDCAALETRILLASHRLGFGPNGVPGRQTVLGACINADRPLDEANCCTVKIAPTLLRRAEVIL